VSGGWNIDTCRLECDSDGICICQTAHPDSEARQIVEVDAYGSTEADSFQVILDYVDSDNYHYAQWEIVTNELKFFKRTGGTPSQLGATETVALAASTWHSLKACFSGTSISASANDGTLYARSTTEHGGYKAGVGGVMGDVDPVYFDDFDYDKYWSVTNSDCETCVATTCGGCEDRGVPELMKVVVAGMADQFCTGCSALDGTYIVEFSSGASGASECYWEDDIFSWSGITCSGADPDRISIILKTKSDGDVLAEVNVQAVYRGWHWWLSSGDGDPRICPSLSDLSLPFDSQGVGAGGRACDSSSATCTVSAL